MLALLCPYFAALIREIDPISHENQQGNQPTVRTEIDWTVDLVV
jgi:hypothetical protein